MLRGKRAPVHIDEDERHLLITKRPALEYKPLKGRLLRMDRMRPLHYACKDGHKEVAKILKADLDAESATGHMPLCHFSINNELETAKKLSAEGEDIDLQSENEYIPLH
ncbi:ankyrin repeat protein nuc-2 [Aspergillus luchuensis]|uniref:Ankyrin repeat protein nuc-2 n=1 Tax=Aspergillus kawachii TaxID=1069201 RepID=A0A146F3S9_ASPKA|nr:hypothetical protein ALUC_40202A [Aspergillus luchuensis]GAT20767.1 ankyrin repeat protein nuc-2 [Aspergillus luchuensis]